MLACSRGPARLAVREQGSPHYVWRAASPKRLAWRTYCAAAPPSAASPAKVAHTKTSARAPMPPAFLAAGHERRLRWVQKVRQRRPTKLESFASSGLVRFPFSCSPRFPCGPGFGLPQLSSLLCAVICWPPTIVFKLLLPLQLRQESSSSFVSTERPICDASDRHFKEKR